MNTHEVPLRERVRAQLLELISEMDLTVNTRLLSEGQLAAKFQVSRSTIRTVLSDLEVEGKVIRRQGSGTYVNSQAIQVNTTLYPRIDLREIVARNGYSARSEVLSDSSGKAVPFVQLWPDTSAAGDPQPVLRG